MRIAYTNLFDSAASITPLTETVLYEATQVQDQRLTTQWRTTGVTDQTIIFAATADTIVGGNIGLVTGSAATNLLVNPENLSASPWAAYSSGAITTANSILGVPAYAVTNSASVGNGYISNYPNYVVPTTSTLSFLVVARKGTGTESTVRIFDASSSTFILQADIAFSTKVVTYDIGAASNVANEWIDDDTVRFYGIANTSVGNGIQMDFVAAGTGLSAIFSAPMVIDNTFPVPYGHCGAQFHSTTHDSSPSLNGAWIIPPGI